MLFSPSEDPLFNQLDHLLNHALASAADNVKRHYAGEQQARKHHEHQRELALRDLQRLAVKYALVSVRLRDRSYLGVGTEHRGFREAVKTEAVSFLLDAHLLLAESRLEPRQ